MTNPYAATETRWFKLDGDLEGMPEWQARAALRAGILFLSALPLMRSPFIVAALLAVDPVEYIVNDGHYYVPVEWLGKQCPWAANDLDNIRQHHIESIVRRN